MGSINKTEAYMHTVRSLLVTLYILVNLRQVAMTGNYGVAYTALTVWHLLYQPTTHTGESFLYWMWVYCTYETLGKRHMSLHKGPRVAGYLLFICTDCEFITNFQPVPLHRNAMELVGDMPSRCTICDSEINFRFVLKGRNKTAFYHIKLLTSWDYSLTSIYLHNADKKYSF